MTLPGIEPFAQGDVAIVPFDGGIKISGVLSMRDPSTTITPYFRRVHMAAVEANVERVTVDLTQLSFMNSSSIRSLVDWVEWIRQEPEDHKYLLSFLSAQGTTWQATTLAAVRVLDEEHVEVTAL